MRPNQQPAARTPERGPADGAVRLAVLTVPAAEEHVALVRLAALHVAEAIGLSVGRVADLRLAADEACGQFLGRPTDPPSRRRASVVVRFELARGLLRVIVRGPVAAGWPDREGLGWLVLSALVGDLRAEQAGGIGTLTLVEHLPAPQDFSFAAL